MVPETIQSLNTQSVSLVTAAECRAVNGHVPQMATVLNWNEQLPKRQIMELKYKIVT